MNSTSELDLKDDRAHVCPHCSAVLVGWPLDTGRNEHCDPRPHLFKPWCDATHVPIRATERQNMSIDDIKKAAGGSTPQNAYDEALRELEVRGRCYPKWVAEGKISRTDADTRFKHQAAAVALLGQVEGVTVNTTTASTEWKPF